MPDIRYGIYYLPPEGSGLAAFGAAWLGWDVTRGAPVAHPDVTVDVSAITATPRVYGFHGTMKPPFRLKDQADQQGLRRAIEALAARHAPFAAPALKLARLGSFLALVPTGESAALKALAADCVQSLDSFRAPAGAAELAKRRASGLTPRQDEILVRWGYPYVLDEFRFHLTLSGKLDPHTAYATQAVLGELTKELTRDPMPVHEICLVQQVDGAPFKLVHRYPLTG
ncbi:MAG: DUF1045 domain-containing protein [Pseudomonadota bacterium]